MRNLYMTYVDNGKGCALARIRKMSLSRPRSARESASGLFFIKDKLLKDCIFCQYTFCDNVAIIKLTEDVYDFSGL